MRVDNVKKWGQSHGSSLTSSSLGVKFWITTAIIQIVSNEQVCETYIDMTFTPMIPPEMQD